MSTCGLVLAGGASRRMGVNKLLLPIDGQGESRCFNQPNQRQVSIVDNVIMVAQQVSDFVRVLGPERDVWSDVTKFERCEVVYDRASYHGPLQALANAWPTETAVEFVLVIAGDLPGVVPDVLRACQERLRESPEDVDGVVIVRDGRAQPLLACYRSRTGAIWRQVAGRGEVRLMLALDRLNLALLDAEAQGWPVWWTRPVHTPEDYQAWLGREV